MRKTSLKQREGEGYFQQATCHCDFSLLHGANQEILIEKKRKLSAVHSRLVWNRFKNLSQRSEMHAGTQVCIDVLRAVHIWITKDMLTPVINKENSTKMSFIFIDSN